MKKDLSTIDNFRSALSKRKQYSLNDFFMSKQNNNNIPYLTKKVLYETTNKTLN